MLMAGTRLKALAPEGTIDPIYQVMDEATLSVIASRSWFNGRGEMLITKIAYHINERAELKDTLKILNVLFKYRVNVNYQVQGGQPDLPAGRTALHLAAQSGDIMLVKFLVKHGAKTTIKDINEQTPVDLTSSDKVGEYLRGLSAEGE